MHTLSPQLRIGVLRGGPSPEYDISLKSGAQVLRHLSATHSPLDIFISKDGTWHMRGVARPPEKILAHVDVVWNALHGTYGEDGTVQGILEHHGVKYTGSGKLSSALAMNKALTKEAARKAGIKTPIYAVVREEDSIAEKVQEIFRSIPRPLIVKPVSSGSSLGLYIVETSTDLSLALETIFSAYPAALVEEYISGREATCGVLDNFRGSETYSFPPVEIIPAEKVLLFDYRSKYSGETKEICPGRFSIAEKNEIERMAKDIHNTLGLSHYSRSDFIVSPRRGVYFLEVNTLPGLTAQSLFPKSVEAVGMTMSEFIHHVLKLSLSNK